LNAYVLYVLKTIPVEENVLLKLHHIDSQFAAHPFKLKLRLLLKRLPDFPSHFNLFSHSLLENPPPIRIAGRVYLNFRCTSVQPEAAGSKFQSVPPFQNIDDSLRYLFMMVASI